MNPYKQEAIARKLERTAKALEQNLFKVHLAENRDDAHAILRTLLRKGESVSCGGSVTLDETGIRELLGCGDYAFFDRDQKVDDQEEFYRRVHTCDTYLTSSNAITENGELYNVDGFGNRVVNFIFGPKRVIVVAGHNKIVGNVQEAVRRVKMIAAPANCMRLGKNTPCAKTGRCIAADGKIEEGCQSEDRICRHYVTTSNQQAALKRIEIVLVAEELGY